MGIYAPRYYEILMIISARAQHKFEKTKETKRQVSIFNKWTIKTQRDAMKSTLCVLYWGTPPIPLTFYNSKYINVLYMRKYKCA
jgi:hypothetical protein